MDDDRKPSSPEFKSFEKRLEQSRKVMMARDAEGENRSSAYSFGFRLATDMIAGVLAGFGIGWGLDWLLNTSPWFLLIFTPIGMAAGIVNVMRAARSAEGLRHLEKTRAEGAKTVTDEDDD